MEDYQSLRNGTDIRGTALMGVKGDEVVLTDEVVTRIVRGFCAFLKKRDIPLKIAIGHDSRLSADRLSALAAEAVKCSGGEAILTGLSSTPSMFMLLKEDFGANASIMITASHMPYQKNGFKFFLEGGGLEAEDIKEILFSARSGNFPEGKGSIREESYLKRYAEGLVRLVREGSGETYPLSGMKIIVDAGGGAGGFYESLVLKELGADTEGSQFLEPDGTFSGHIPNPEDETAMRSICEAVKKSNADFGIIFDTDVDRAGAVLRGGAEINRNRLIALVSAILLREHKHAAIVTDSVTSNGLADFIERHGGVHHRFKRGYRNVINEAIRLNREGVDAVLAMETSGHAALKENYFLDDGAYLVTKLLIELSKARREGRELSDLICDLAEPKEAKECRLSFAAGADFKTLGNKIIEDLKEEVKKREGISLAPNNFEGVRVNFDEKHGNGWALVRLSLHDPILPVNIESDEEGGAEKILAFLRQFLKGYPFLNTENLK